ncbi:MAG: hypothetical protein H5T41_11205, partial [Methanomassiliicoccales archaeon]|nr:hypothetical protein [Methanomassiliicoccales archaeon]
MELFSERHGFTRGRKTLQLKSMDKKLRVALYNYLHRRFEQEWYPEESSYPDWFKSEHPELFEVASSMMGPGYYEAERVWPDLWNLTLDTFGTKETFLETLKAKVMKGRWYKIYDFIESLVKSGFVDSDAVNSILEREMSGYRVINGFVVAITDKIELAELEKAVSLPDPFAGVRAHINSALEKLAQRPEPDLRNAVKEAISAVESAARIITGTGRKKATLGDLLKVLEEQGLHSALREAW